MRRGEPFLLLTGYSVDQRTIGSAAGLHVPARLCGQASVTILHVGEFPVRQLASLLIVISEHLGASAVSRIQPPSDAATSKWRELIQPIVLTRPFLWPNHLEAIGKGLLKSGLSAVISFPTGAGKTTLSELKVAVTLAEGRSVIYLAPTHALVGQVKNSLKATFPTTAVHDSFQSEDYYAETGEIFATDAAAILVMTPERCLALLSGEDTDNFERVGLVIFDECHLIHPKGSGHNRRSLDAMLAVLSLTKSSPHADWLMLSAMVANSDELAAWFQELTGRQWLSLNLNWKPTRQARGCLLYDSTEIVQLNAKIKADRVRLAKLEKPPKTPPTSLKQQMQARPYALFCLQQTWQTLQREDYALLPLSDLPMNLTVSVHPYTKQWQVGPNKNEVAAQLAARCMERGLKVLLFTHSPTFANSIAEKINEIVRGTLTEAKLEGAEKRLLAVTIDEVGRESGLYPYRPAACHHGLLLPSERELVEGLFRRAGGIMALSATPTLAQGINLPADVVLIVGDERFDANANQSKQLDAHEILNAAGRAGRAGYVAQGIVIVLPQQALAMDAKANKLPSQWFNLQKAIFSQADGCLQVGDPVRYFLDRVQDATSIEEPEIRYFLQRIPRDAADSETNASEFFSRTLAAFQAKRRDESAPFLAKVKHSISRRREMETTDVPSTWREELAFRTGVASAFITSLDEKLLQDTPQLPESSEGLIVWLCDWLRKRPEFVTGVFAHRLTKDFHDLFSEEDDLFGNRFVQMTVAWLNGATLADINKIVKEPSGDSKYQEARKFARIVPDIAFAAGLVTKIRRKQIEESGDGEMPVTLAVLSLCVRLGLATPELAAVKLAYRDEHISRKRIRDIWEEARPYARRGSKSEKFNQTRDRVNEAVMHLVNAKGGLEI